MVVMGPLLPLYHCCHGTTAAMVPLLSWYHCCHGTTAVVVPLLPWYHCRHGTTAAMVPLLPWYHCRHGTTVTMVPLLPWYHCRHGTTAAMLPLLPSSCFCLSISPACCLLLTSPTLSNFVYDSIFPNPISDCSEDSKVCYTNSKHLMTATQFSYIRERLSRNAMYIASK